LYKALSNHSSGQFSKLSVLPKLQKLNAMKEQEVKGLVHFHYLTSTDLMKDLGKNPN
jgi:hypothetical protein